MTCVIAPVFAFFIHSIYKVPAVPRRLAYPVRTFMWVDNLRATTSACRAQVSHSIDLLPIRVLLSLYLFCGRSGSLQFLPHVVKCH